MSWNMLRGRIVADPALPGFSPQERGAIYASMGETLARLHTLDWREIRLGDFGRPDRYAERQIERWRRQSESASIAPLPEMERVHDWLTDNVPDTEMAAVTHGDYRMGNLMLDLSRPRVAAVLDWELSTIGHPWADLAFNCMAYYFPPEAGPASGIAGLDLEALGIPSEQHYLEEYARRTGSDPRPHWRFFMTLSLYRTAAIQQGVHARALAGQAQGPEARMFAQLCRTTAAIACDVAFGERVSR
jgi:aminoglycoside phosphotransferase (APT) family kinase protein